MNDTLLFVVLGGKKGGRGKVDRQHFFSYFVRAVISMGLKVRITRNSDAIQSDLLARSAALVLIYNEEDLCASDASSVAIRAEWDRLQQRCQSAGFNGLLVHDLSIGELLGVKASTNLKYASAGIPVPQIMTASVAVPVFSNANLGSGKDVSVLPGASALDGARYNTQYINTEIPYGGRRYHVCLRALAVGQELISVYVRARDVAEGSASVHNADTPLDAGLIRHINDTLMQPRMTEIQSICERAGALLGLGFYVHDILPCQETGGLYVCESGIKLGDAKYRRCMQPIANQMPDQRLFSKEEAQDAARAFVRQLSQKQPISLLQLDTFAYHLHNVLARIRFRTG